MLRKHPTDNCRFQAGLGICWVSRPLKALKRLGFSRFKNHSFTTWSVYYIGATDCPQKATSTSAKIVLDPEAEQERFWRPQEKINRDLFLNLI